MHIALYVHIIVYCFFLWSLSAEFLPPTQILKVSFHESSSLLPIALAAWYIGTQCLDGRTTQERSWQRHQKFNPKQPFFPQSCRIMRCLISQQRGHLSQGDFRNALSEGHTYVRVELAQGKWTFARTSASITVFHSMLFVNRCSISASMRGWQGWQQRVLVERVRSRGVGGLGMLSMLQYKSKEYRGQLLSGARTAKQRGKS